MKTFTDLANGWIRDLSSYEPGRPIEEVACEFGFARVEEIAKLASNENELGPSRKAIRAMKESAKQMHRYPDGDAFYLRRALAKKLGVEPDQILVGCGSNEIIEFIGHVFLDKGVNVVVSEGAFAIYALVAAEFQAATVAAPMRDFTHDLDAMLKAITPETRVVFIANPNNPTGTMVDGKAIDRFMSEAPEHVVVVIDEAYTELLPPRKQPDTLKHVRSGSKVIVLRTFSKTYGLAGLRVGYAIAPQECIRLLHRVRQPFNVSAMGLVAALAALDDDAHVRRTQRMVRQGLRYLEDALTKMSVPFVPSVANFMLVKVGDGRRVFEEMMKEKVIVRPMNMYGLPEYVRVSVGAPVQNGQFIQALQRVLGGKTS